MSVMLKGLFYWIQVITTKLHMDKKIALASDVQYLLHTAMPDFL